MTTPQLLVLLAVVVVAVVLVWLLVRRSAARKDGARAEAAGLRAQAEGVAGTLAGQQAFAEQAEDRAHVARAEADRLAAEASGYRETVEVTRDDHRSLLARADEVDPDVDASDEAGRRPMTRAEARQMREEAERAAWAGSPAAPVPGAAGAAVMGRDEGVAVRGPAVEEPEPAQPWSEESPAVEEPVGGGEPVAEEPVSEESPAVEEPVAEDVVVEEPGADESTPVEAPEQEPAAQDPQSEERSARIAAATDFRDGDTGDDAEEEPYVWGASRAGTGEHMDEQPEVDDTTPTAATDAAAPPGEWGGPHASDEGSPSDDTPSDDPADESPADAAAADEAATDEAATDEVAEGSEVAEDPGAGAFTEPEEPAAHEAEAYDPTPERDWSADEGELLAETGDRADELAAEREQMDRDAAAVGMEPVHPEVVERAEEQETADEPVEEQAPADEPVEVQEPADEPVEEQAPAEPETSSTDEGDAPADHTDEEPAATTPRRVSEFHEIRDGGYGMGSAAAIDDGAQPMDHPVQAYRDTMTYRLPGDAGYDEATADVWFYDQGAAERSGFHRSEG